MEKEGMCPFCKTMGKIYGLPYNLPMLSYDENKYRTIDKVILINCGGCGAILGVYKNEGLKVELNLD